MPLPLAHGLIGATVVAGLHKDDADNKIWKPLLIGALLAVSPDLDIAISLLRVFGGGWHHDFTHSLPFAFFVGSLTAWAGGRGRFRWRTALIFSLAMASHPLMDFLFTDGRGVELLWPFSQARIKVGLEPLVNYSWDHHTVPGRIIDLTQMSLNELMLFGSLFLTALGARQTGRRAESFISPRDDE